MADINASASNTISVTHIPRYSIGPLHYGTILGGDAYFQDRLKRSSWEDSTNADKRRALMQATHAIERLNFQGDKNSATQTLQFPRGSDTTIPVEIDYATYELAYQLLDGVDPDSEIDRMRVQSNKYADIETEYNFSGGVPIYVMAGIPSFQAWAFLTPYLRDHSKVLIMRV